MDTTLEVQSSPIAITDGFIKKGETSIIMQCHDRVFSRVTVLDEAGSTPFKVESKGMASLSWRRTVKDASGTPIFDLRRVNLYGFYIRSKWVVERPSGRELCSMKHVTFEKRQALDVVVRNEEDNGNEVMVEVRPKDRKAITTQVNVGGAAVAEIQLTEVNDTVKLRGDRSDWKARVAGGVDLALVSISVVVHILVRS
jgi:hypothetical protein